MKRTIYILAFIVYTITFNSCTKTESTKSVNNNSFIKDTLINAYESNFGDNKVLLIINKFGDNINGSIIIGQHGLPMEFNCEIESNNKIITTVSSITKIYDSSECLTDSITGYFIDNDSIDICYTDLFRNFKQNLKFRKINSTNKIQPIAYMVNEDKDEIINYFKLENGDSINDVLNKNIKDLHFANLKKEFDNYANDSRSMNSLYFLAGTAEVKSFTDKYLSINSVVQVECCGGGHFVNDICNSYDLKTGNKIVLSQLFNEEDLYQINEIIKHNFKIQNPDNRWDDEGGLNFFDSENFKSRYMNNFIIYGGGLRFGLGDFASLGDLFVYLDYKQMKIFLKKESVKYFN